MDMDAYERILAEGRLQDALEDGEETEDDEERGEEDEHPVETKVGVCLICLDNVGTDLDGHMTSHHPNYFKGSWKIRQVSFVSGSHSSAYSALEKDRAYIQHLYGGSSHDASLNTVPDPILSSFFGSFSDVDLPKHAQEEILDQVIEKTESLEQKPAERLRSLCSLRLRRSQLVQGLVLSAMFDDIL